MPACRTSIVQGTTDENKLSPLLTPSRWRESPQPARARGHSAGRLADCRIPPVPQDGSAWHATDGPPLRWGVPDNVQCRRGHTAPGADSLAHLTNVSCGRQLGANTDSRALPRREAARLCHLDGEADL